MLHQRSRVVFAGCAILAGAGVLLCSGSGVAQPAPSAVQKLERLPATLSARSLLADRVVALLPSGSPPYLAHTKHSEMLAPPFNPAPRRFIAVPEQVLDLLRPCQADHIYNRGAFPSIIRKQESDADAAGCEGTFLPGGAVTTGTHAFFELLGTNGRTCATCHQPPNAMSVSTANIVARMQATSGTDPIFAGVDGANCPSSLPPYTGNGSAFKAAHSLLLQRGLFRIFIQVPGNAQFTVSAQHDPNGCNTKPPFNEDTLSGQTVQMVSTYRRPRISANLNFVNSFVPPPNVPSGASIMWDTRELSLENQANDATHGHAQATGSLTPAQIAQIVAFETTVFSAQVRDNTAHILSTAGATGGPVALASAPTGQGGPPANVTFNEYNAWAGLSGSAVNDRRASIARGEAVFNAKSFIISDVAGVNDVAGVGNHLTGTCSGCHSQTHAGNDIFGKIAVLDIGVGGGSSAHNGPAPSPVLPIFTVACTGGKTTPFNGSTVHTNDLGLAMITGNCADIGKFSVPQLRGVGSHAPFFHDGSAPTLDAVVGFYDKRFSIGLTPAERLDLVNFLKAL